MGQSLSDEARPPSKEEITADLAEKFARKCFEPLELYSFKHNFKSLADHEQNVRYLKEETIARFLELPDILAVSPVVFHMVSCIGAFPFLQDAPVILGFEQMIMVVTIMTERYAKILARGNSSRRKLLFKSLAVYDRKLSEIEKQQHSTSVSGHRSTNHAPGFAVDEAGDELDDDAEDDDELVLAALDSLDINDAFKTGDSHAATTHGAMIPADNFRKLIMLLLLVSPLDAQENLSSYAHRVTGTDLEDLRATAENILSAFIDVEKSPVIQPPLLQEKGQILNLSILSQLSFFIRGNELFRRLRLLYSGSEAGLPDSSNSGGSEGTFTDSLPPKRFPNGSPPDRDRLVFGALVRQPWRHTHKECFGGEDTLLFQLAPTHDVFPASAINRDYVAFTKPPTANPGINFGCPHPKASQSRHQSLRHLGPVSLVVDSSFEFGVFTHDYASRGGAFGTSVCRKYNFQERFQVDEIEIWGCGGDEEARIQRERWEWEAREAEARRRVNLGTGDIAADRALLEMAGLVGTNRSGGSMA
ncbi:hypothetical protein ABKA04_008288 [Annulohypoxylon sp. FPYF3050]